MDSSVIQNYIRSYEEESRADATYFTDFCPQSLHRILTDCPHFSCPDKRMEDIYYFRLWTYQKHIRKTPDGYVITEFLPDVPWAGLYNAIVCPAAHHIHEGRWLSDTQYLKAYIRHFAVGKGNEKDVLTYQNAFLEAAADFVLTCQDPAFMEEMTPALDTLYERTKKAYASPFGLYVCDDDRDGMEYSISGYGLRPTINSYIYAAAIAIAKLWKVLGREQRAEVLMGEAAEIKKEISRLWDETDGFFKTVPVVNGHADFEHLDSRRNVREQIGFIPFLYGAAERRMGTAFQTLSDPSVFSAPFGITTADMSHPLFRACRVDHECLWDGPVWPYATSQTVGAVIRALTDGWNEWVSADLLYSLIRTYADSHFLSESGKVRHWIDEDQDPFTGEWIARKELLHREGQIPERGRWYNHSTFVDLIISGLCGIQRSFDGKDLKLEVHPHIPDNWTWFSLEHVSLGDKRFSVYYDKDGTVFGQGQGVRVIEDCI